MTDDRPRDAWKVEFRKALEEEIEAHKNPATMAARKAKREREEMSAALGIKPMTDDEFRILLRRMIAQLIRMPVICPARCCRKYRQCCCIEGTICLVAHRATAAERINLLLGWPVCAVSGEGEDD